MDDLVRQLLADLGVSLDRLAEELDEERSRSGEIDVEHFDQLMAARAAERRRER